MNRLRHPSSRCRQCPHWQFSTPVVPPVRGPAARPRRRAAFTFIELSISLAVMTLVVGAVVGITCAVTEGWAAAGQTQSLQTTSFQATSQLERLLRSANYVGMAAGDSQAVIASAMSTGANSAAPVPTATVPAGSAGAAIIIWTDANNDQKMQLSELAVIEHDVANQKLLLYRVPASAPNAGTRFHTTDISYSTSVAVLKALPYMACCTLGSNISAASFCPYYTGSRADRQTIEFRLTFAGDNGAAQQQTPPQYGCVSLRAALVPTDSP